MSSEFPLEFLEEFLDGEMLAEDVGHEADCDKEDDDRDKDFFAMIERELGS